MLAGSILHNKGGPSSCSSDPAAWHTSQFQSQTEMGCVPLFTCATAGSISSKLRMAVALSVRSSRLRPASASSVAEHTPSDSLRMRLCTLPRKFSTCGKRAEDSGLHGMFYRAEVQHREQHTPSHSLRMRLCTSASEFPRLPADVTRQLKRRERRVFSTPSPSGAGNCARSSGLPICQQGAAGIRDA